MIDDTFINYLKIMQGRKIAVKLSDVLKTKEDEVIPHIEDDNLRQHLSVTIKKVGGMSSPAYYVTLVNVLEQDEDYYSGYKVANSYILSSPFVMDYDSASGIWTSKLDKAFNKNTKANVFKLNSLFLDEFAQKSQVDVFKTLAPLNPTNINTINLYDHLKYGDVSALKYTSSGFIKLSSTSYITNMLDDFKNAWQIQYTAILLPIRMTFELRDMAQQIYNANDYYGPDESFGAASFSMYQPDPDEFPEDMPHFYLGDVMYGYRKNYWWTYGNYLASLGKPMNSDFFGKPDGGPPKGWFVYDIPMLDEPWEDDTNVVEDFEKFLLEALK